MRGIHKSCPLNPSPKFGFYLKWKSQSGWPDEFVKNRLKCIPSHFGSKIIHNFIKSLWSQMSTSGDVQVKAICIWQILQDSINIPHLLQVLSNVLMSTPTYHLYNCRPLLKWLFRGAKYFLIFLAFTCVCLFSPVRYRIGKDLQFNHSDCAVL
jgi:hypothetical protein